MTDYVPPGLKNMPSMQPPQEEPKVVLPIPAGTIFTATEGFYHDVHGVFRALVDIDPNALVTEYRAHLDAGPADKFGDRYLSDTDFLVWMFHKGVMELVPSMEWFLPNGDCSKMEVDHQDIVLDELKGGES